MIMCNHNLRMFVAVAETGSVTETAEKLFVSQPAVSQAIRSLERELGVKLFHRDKRQGLLLTDVGREILLLAHQMEDVENRIYQTAYRFNNFLGGRVRVASMPLLTSVVLAPVLAAFQRDYPQVKVELLEGTSMEIRRAVEEHRADFGVTPAPYGELQGETLTQDKLVAVTPCPLPEGTVVDLAHWPERFLLCQAGLETLRETLGDQGVPWGERLVVQEAETVLRLAECGNGTGLISQLVTQVTPHRLHTYPIFPQVDIPIGLVAKDLHDLPPVAAELKGRIQTFCQEK